MGVARATASGPTRGPRLQSEVKASDNTRLIDDWHTLPNMSDKSFVRNSFNLWRCDDLTLLRYLRTRTWPWESSVTLPVTVASKTLCEVRWRRIGSMILLLSVLNARWQEGLASQIYLTCSLWKKPVFIIKILKFIFIFIIKIKIYYFIFIIISVFIILIIKWY